MDDVSNTFNRSASGNNVLLAVWLIRTSFDDRDQCSVVRTHAIEYGKTALAECFEQYREGTIRYVAGTS